MSRAKKRVIKAREIRNRSKARAAKKARRPGRKVGGFGMAKRTPAQLARTANRIIDALWKHGPMRTEQICKAARLDFAEVRLPLLKLRALGDVEKQGGNTRDTTYAIV